MDKTKLFWSQKSDQTMSIVLQSPRINLGIFDIETGHLMDMDMNYDWHHVTQNM